MKWRSYSATFEITKKSCGCLFSIIKAAQNEPNNVGRPHKGSPSDPIRARNEIHRECTMLGYDVEREIMELWK